LPLIALWSYAHRVGTTFALDWSKAREAKVTMGGRKRTMEKRRPN